MKRESAAEGEVEGRRWRERANRMVWRLLMHDVASPGFVEHSTRVVNLSTLLRFGVDASISS